MHILQYPNEIKIMYIINTMIIINKIIIINTMIIINKLIIINIINKIFIINKIKMSINTVKLCPSRIEICFPFLGLR